MAEFSFSKLVKGARPKVRFRTQLTPELEIDLASDEPTPPPQEPGLAAVAMGWFMRNVVRPEFEVEVGGLRKSEAPWGKPTTDLSPVVMVAGGVALASVALIGYRLWKKGRP